MTDDLALKIHYQNLKARCIELAISRQTAANVVLLSEASVVVEAKEYYNEITGQDWRGPDVEGA